MVLIGALGIGWLFGTHCKTLSKTVSERLTHRLNKNRYEEREATFCIFNPACVDNGLIWRNYRSVSHCRLLNYMKTQTVTEIELKIGENNSRECNYIRLPL